MLSNPSSVPASAAPPPDVESSAGAHFVPFHFKTCPEDGALVVVSTSESLSIENAATIVKPSAVPLTCKKPPDSPE